MGVDVFLLILGFLIFSILVHKKAQPDYVLKGTLKYFYGSRFKRIAPIFRHADSGVFGSDCAVFAARPSGLSKKL